MIGRSPPQSKVTPAPRTTRNTASTDSVHVELDQSQRIRVVGGAIDQDLLTSSAWITSNLDTLVEHDLTGPNSDSDVFQNASDQSSKPRFRRERSTSVFDNLQAQISQAQASTSSAVTQESQIRANSPLLIVIDNEGNSDRENALTPPLNTNEVVFDEEPSEEEMATLTAKDVSDLIPKFDGKFENLEAFIGTVTMLEAEVREADKRLFLLMVKAKLFGKAYDAIKYSTDLNTWDRVKETLTNNIAPPVSAQAAQNQLFRAQQNSGESVRAFSDRVKSFLNILNKVQCKDVDGEVATHIQNNNALTAKHVFEDGLSDSRLKTILISANKATLDEAVTTALEQEVRLQNRRYENHQFCKTCRKEGHLADKCPTKNSKPSGPKCAHCGSPGHQSEACYSLRNRQAQTSGEKPTPNPNTGVPQAPRASEPPKTYDNLRCNYCKQLGHIIRDCPTRPPRPVTVVRTVSGGQPIGTEGSQSENL